LLFRKKNNSAKRRSQGIIETIPSSSKHLEYTSRAYDPEIVGSAK